MRIAILVEGKTEMAFKRILLDFLQSRLAGCMPKLDFVPFDGRIPRDKKLRRLVDNLLSIGPAKADAVIALTDVYTGTREFADAADAKRQMTEWVGSNPRFHPHAAQYEFEAWLLVYWIRIQKLAGHNKSAPAGQPETVNHDRPPAERIAEIFRIGSCGRRYVKARDVLSILQNQDLVLSANACPELRAFLNTILRLSGAQLLQ
jgi:hypothetical protein